MSDYGESGTAHRTTYGHFLAKGKWDDKRLEETQKRESFQTVSELSRRDGTPLFINIKVWFTTQNKYLSTLLFRILASICWRENIAYLNRKPAFCCL